MFKIKNNNKFAILIILFYFSCVSLSSESLDSPSSQNEKLNLTYSPQQTQLTGLAGVLTEDSLDFNQLSQSKDTFEKQILVAKSIDIPIGALIRVVNLLNNRSITVRLVSYLDSTSTHLLDLSELAAEKLDINKLNPVPVRIFILEIPIASSLEKSPSPQEKESPPPKEEKKDDGNFYQKMLAATPNTITEQDLPGYYQALYENSKVNSDMPIPQMPESLEKSVPRQSLTDIQNSSNPPFAAQNNPSPAPSAPLTKISPPNKMNPMSSSSVNQVAPLNTPPSVLTLSELKKRLSNQPTYVLQVAAYQNLENLESHYFLLKNLGFAVEARQTSSLYKLYISSIRKEKINDTQFQLLKAGFEGVFISQLEGIFIDMTQ